MVKLYCFSEPYRSAVGYQLTRSCQSCFSDTSTHDAFWSIVNKIGNLKYLIIESACNERDIAIRSKHLCPSLLIEELEKLECEAEILISHLKPGEADITMDEIRQCLARFNPKRLENNQLFEF